MAVKRKAAVVLLDSTTVGVDAEGIKRLWRENRISLAEGARGLFQLGFCLSESWDILQRI